MYGIIIHILDIKIKDRTNSFAPDKQAKTLVST